MKTLIIVFLLVMVSSLSFAAPISYNAEEIKYVSESIARAIAASYNLKEYAKMAVYFSDDMFKSFPQSKFEEKRNILYPLYGEISNVSYMGYLTEQDSTVVLYKGIAQKSEILIKIVLSKINEKVFLVGVWFE